MAQALDVARYLIHLAAQEPEADPLTPLRLQKLLYYVQGYALAFYDRPAFPERIEAWTNGPGVPEVYQAFKTYGDAPLPASEATTGEGLTPQERDHIASVWGGHRQYSASELWRRTHREKPWRTVWGDRPTDARGEDEIPHDLLRVFFKAEYERLRIPGLEEKLARARQQVEEGHTIKLGDLVKKLGLEDAVRAGAGR